MPWNIFEELDEAGGMNNDGDTETYPLQTVPVCYGKIHHFQWKDPICLMEKLNYFYSHFQ